SVCVISENGEDRLYLTVWRTIQGVERLFIERMASTLWDSAADACYLDCAVSYAYDDPQATFARLSHLEGRTVNALADGAVVRGLV
ncbi:hypothetical protein ABI011_14935, partial [Enterococcus faecium]|uniref:hypothetical protein n=1 Tax=Enterococcus faecium TaxID=1352 RepID=UPI003F42DA6B